MRFGKREKVIFTKKLKHGFKQDFVNCRKIRFV